MPEKTRNVAQRQAWVCIECAKKILNSSRAHQPADKALMQYFRENKQLGARDRRLIRSAIFAMFRW